MPVFFPPTIEPPAIIMQVAHNATPALPASRPHLPVTPSGKAPAPHGRPGGAGTQDAPVPQPQSGSTGPDLVGPLTPPPPPPQ